MQSITVRELKKMEFFRELPNDLLQTILNEGRIREYKKKEVIFHAKSKVDSVYIVLEGEAMLYNITKHGNRKIIFILGKGKLLNQTIINEQPTSVFCEAADRVVVLQISLRTFRSLMDHQPELMKAVMGEYERYLWRLSHQLKNTTGNMQMERKIAAKLWKLGRDFGVQEEAGMRIDLYLTITLMADLIGAPRENVSRACKALADKGLIQYRNKCFILPDPNGLADFYKM